MENPKCPVCSSFASVHFLTVKDHTVSGAFFELVKCSDCSFVFTANPPSKGDIGHYYQSSSYISHTDSKKGIFDKVYQLIRAITLQGKRKLVESIVPGKKGRILDYGCGTGAFLKEMVNNGWNIAGIEPDFGAREKAAFLTGIEIQDTNSLESFQPASIDAITLWHVLEHVHDLEHVLVKFHEILESNGVLLIAVPNRTSYDAIHYSEYWAAYDVPRHLYHFTPDTIDNLLHKHGFTKSIIKPMWFDSFYVSLLSEKYKKGKMNVLAAFAVGLISNVKAFLKPGTCSSQIYIYRKK
jgi:predicted SAM-dependent methyltransferase